MTRRCSPSPISKDYPVYRWQAEACSLLDERLASLMPVDQKNIQRVTSFEMMALWVAAGYGIGRICAIAHRACSWVGDPPCDRSPMAPMRS
jgi:DNA-binding transcriptional LysR family regulator